MQPDSAEEEMHTLARRCRKEPLFVHGPSTRTVDHGRAAIERLLPHRDPFLFVERIVAIDIEQRAIEGTRRIDPADPIFAGHFPGAPLYPGVLQLETMGQLGICLAHFLRRESIEVPLDATPLEVRALKIHTATFLAEVLPDHEVKVLAKLLVDDEYTSICAGQLWAGGRIAATAIMEMYHVESD